MEGNPSDKDYFQLAFNKRPSEELYVLADDAYNLKNEIDNPEYKQELEILRKDLAEWMIEKNDLRATEPQTVYWDTVLYTPDYKFFNYNLDKKIGDYKMAIRDGGNFKEISCLD